MRQQFAYRPLIGLFFGTVFGLSFTFGFWALLALPLSLFLIRDLKFNLLVIIGFLIGFLLQPPVPSGFFEQKNFSGVGIIHSVPQQSGENRVAVFLNHDEKFRLIYPRELLLTKGDSVSIVGTLQPLSEVSGYGGGAKGVVKADTIELRASGPPWWKWGDNISRSFSSTIDEHLSTRVSPLIKGICFNQTDGLSSEDWEAFRKFGVIHILSASGFHVVVISVGLLFLLSMFPIPRAIQLSIVLATLFMFAIAAGFRPPIVRSVLMALIIMPAYLFKREADGLSAVAMAGFINLIFTPEAIVDLGFLLSMIATTGLVCLITHKNWQTYGTLKRAIFPTLVATGVTMPLSAFVFGEISLIGVVGNIIVAPLVALLVLLSLGSWILTLLIPPLGTLLFRVVDYLGSITFDLSVVGSQLPGSLIPMPGFSIVTLVALYGLLVLGWRKYAMD